MLIYTVKNLYYSKSVRFRKQTRTIRDRMPLPFLLPVRHARMLCTYMMHAMSFRHPASASVAAPAPASCFVLHVRTKIRMMIKKTKTKAAIATTPHTEANVGY